MSTATLEDIRIDDDERNADVIAKRMQYVHDVWAGTIPDAETGLARQKALGLGFDVAERMLALLDNRQLWAEQMAAADKTIKAGSEAEQGLQKLDAEFAAQRQRYEAARAPLVAMINAMTLAADERAMARNNLLKNLLPHVAARKVAIEREAAVASVKLSEARGLVVRDETIARRLPGELAKAEQRFNDGDKRASRRQEIESAKQAIARQETKLATAQDAEAAAKVSFDEADAAVNALAAELLKPWSA